MHGLALIMGHLLGDYIFQRDWEARLKVAVPPAGPEPPAKTPGSHWPNIIDIQRADAWRQEVLDAKWGPFACTYHCLMYTLAVFLTCFWFLPPWAYPVVFLAHWPVDRYRLAAKFMTLNGQSKFASGPLSPWSMVVVDNVFHLLVLYVLGLAAVL